MQKIVLQKFNGVRKTEENRAQNKNVQSTSYWKGSDCVYAYAIFQWFSPQDLEIELMTLAISVGVVGEKVSSYDLRKVFREELRL